MSNKTLVIVIVVIVAVLGLPLLASLKKQAPSESAPSASSGSQEDAYEMIPYTIRYNDPKTGVPGQIEGHAMRMLAEIWDGNAQQVRDRINCGIDWNRKLVCKGPDGVEEPSIVLEQLESRVNAGKLPMDLFSLALDKGANANTQFRNPNFYGPLGHAAFVGNLECVQIALDHGADPKGSKGNGWQPIHQACQRSSISTDPAQMQTRIAIVQLLISHGADINAQAGKEHETPLSRARLFAERSGDMTLVNWLQSQGAR